MMEKYKVIETIGVGSFGKAILVQNKTDMNLYVIKQINVKEMGEKERNDAMREVKVLSMLKHPNIIAYHESFVHEGFLNIVIDYADGGDIYQCIQAAEGKHFSEDLIMDWFVQIALALKHVHDCNILHRDLKTQNIFVTKRNVIKLGDFGIAKVLNSGTDFAKTVIGTPYYLSPELCEDQPYNQKSDVWALGCVLYELTTLKHAFDGQNLPALILKILRGKFPPIPAHYSDNLRNLITWMLKKDPKDRPSIDDVINLPFVKAKIQHFIERRIIRESKARRQRGEKKEQPQGAEEEKANHGDWLKLKEEELKKMSEALHPSMKQIDISSANKTLLAKKQELELEQRKAREAEKYQKRKDQYAKMLKNRKNPAKAESPPNPVAQQVVAPAPVEEKKEATPAPAPVKNLPRASFRKTTLLDNAFKEDTEARQKHDKIKMEREMKKAMKEKLEEAKKKESRERHDAKKLEQEKRKKEEINALEMQKEEKRKYIEAQQQKREQRYREAEEAKLRILKHKQALKKAGPRFKEHNGAERGGADVEVFANPARVQESPESLGGAVEQSKADSKQSAGNALMKTSFFVDFEKPKSNNDSPQKSKSPASESTPDGTPRTHPPSKTSAQADGRKQSPSGAAKKSKPRKKPGAPSTSDIEERIERDKEEKRAAMERQKEEFFKNIRKHKKQSKVNDVVVEIVLPPNVQHLVPNDQDQTSSTHTEKIFSTVGAQNDEPTEGRAKHTRNRSLSGSSIPVLVPPITDNTTDDSVNTSVNSEIEKTRRWSTTEMSSRSPEKPLSTAPPVDIASARSAPTTTIRDAKCSNDEDRDMEENDSCDERSQNLEISLPPIEKLDLNHAVGSSPFFAQGLAHQMTIPSPVIDASVLENHSPISSPEMTLDERANHKAAMLRRLLQAADDNDYSTTDDDEETKIIKEIEDRTRMLEQRFAKELNAPTLPHELKDAWEEKERKDLIDVLSNLEAIIHNTPDKQQQQQRQLILSQIRQAAGDLGEGDEEDDDYTAERSLNNSSNNDDINSTLGKTARDERLGLRIEKLRQTCEKHFGPDMFIKLYRYLRDEVVKADDDDVAAGGGGGGGMNHSSTNQKKLLEILNNNEELLKHVRDVHQLIYCEDIFYG